MIVVFTFIHFVSEMVINENRDHGWTSSWTKEPWVAAGKKSVLRKSAISAVVQAIMLQWWGKQSLPNLIAALQWQAGQSDGEAECLSYAMSAPWVQA